MASISTMNSQVARRKEASAGGIIRPLLTYSLLSFLPPAKEPPPVLRSESRGHGHPTPASAAASDLRQGGQGPGQRDSGRGDMRPPRGRFPGQAGKIFCGEPTAKSEMTDFWPSLLVWSFYGLLAMFPAVTAFVSLYGLFAKASTISDHLALAAGVIPSGGVGNNSGANQPHHG